MSFGAFQGNKLKDVPAWYLLYIYENKKLSEKMKKYINDNRQALEKEKKRTARMLRR